MLLERVPPSSQLFPSSIGWFPPKFVQFVCPDTFEGMSPSDAASQQSSEVDVDGSFQHSTHTTRSILSGSSQRNRCFSPGTMIRKSNGDWVFVGDLKQFDYVQGANSGVVRILSLQRVHANELVEIVASGSKLITTVDHHYLVRRGDRWAPLRADSLRVGEDILVQPCDGYSTQSKKVTEIRTFLTENTDVSDVFQIEFEGDEAVPASNFDAIVTKGHRSIHTYRGGRRHQRSQCYYPSTAWEWDDE